MLNYIHIGRYGVEAALGKRLQTASPLNTDLVLATATAFGSVRTETGFAIEGHPFMIDSSGHLWSVSPILKKSAICFVVTLCDQTGSVVVDQEGGCVWTGEEFGDHSERLVRMARDIPQLFRGNAETPN